MKFKLACVSLGLAYLAGAGAPAFAGDFNKSAGGLKEGIYAAGVPVPAPAPAPLYEPDWYVRADFGYSFSTDSGASVNGGGFTPYGDLDGPASVSVGFGRYITPTIRGEFLLDFRNDYKVGSATQNYSGVVTETATTIANGGPGGTNRHYYDVTRNDEVRIGHYSGMVNMYYDFKNHSRFTPYLGAGAGLVVHTLKRRSSESATCNYSTNDATGAEVAYDDATAALNPVCAGPGQLSGTGQDDPNTAHPDYNHTNATAVETGYGLGANIMAGVAFEVHPGVVLDVNYRYSWLGGDVKVIAPTLDRSSTVKIGDSTEHAIRTGVRWNIN